MKTYSIHEGILVEEFRSDCIKDDKSASYRVCDIRLDDISEGGIDNLNDRLVDNMVDNGYLLSGVSYKIVDCDKEKNTITIQVDVDDCVEWLEHANDLD